jgi:hypothetical protein
MNPTHFEGRKWAYRQTKEGTVISFLVHPNDISPELATAPLGARLMVAFAAIGDDEKLADLPSPPPSGDKKPWGTMKRVQQAGILCADPNFQKWLSVFGQPNPEEAAKHEIYRICKVQSRKMLDHIEWSGNKWDDLVARYRTSTGRMTEAR